MTLLQLLFLILTLASLSPSQVVVRAQETLEPQQLYDMLTMQESYVVLLDVRSESEWNNGHIENATFVESLGRSGVEPPAELLDCTACTVVVYCRSGARASAAITRLIQEYGFEASQLYNGRGTSQWTSAGYPLVTTPSVVPQCKERMCGADNAASTTTTMAPTVSPTTSPPVVWLTATELYEGLQTNQFDMLLDVRSVTEWESGHIENATLVEDLASSSEAPLWLWHNDSSCPGFCRVVVTCRSGARAGAAIQKLQSDYNMTNTQFYNGGGTSQWTAAGYSLVTSQSNYLPRCAVDDDNNESANTTLPMVKSVQECRLCCQNDDDAASNETDTTETTMNSGIQNLEELPIESSSAATTTTYTRFFWMLLVLVPVVDVFSRK